VEKPGFQDLFSRDAASYARFRPRYPPDLFAWIAGLPAHRRVGWDCATGNGQAATLLAPHFGAVIGSDASREQLGAATRMPGVSYVACYAEQPSLAAASVDLITVAQAFHWLDHGAFYREVDRILAPGGALAIVGYARLVGDSEVTRIVHAFQDGRLGGYWSPERKLVDAGYEGIPIPIDEVAAPPFAIVADLSLPQLLGYIGTWSAVGRYRVMEGQDPMLALAADLAAVWEQPETVRRISWPLFVRAGRWRSHS